MSDFKVKDGWVIAESGAKLNGIDPISHEVTMRLNANDVVDVYSPNGYHELSLKDFGIRAQDFLLNTHWNYKVNGSAK